MELHPRKIQLCHKPQLQEFLTEDAEAMLTSKVITQQKSWSNKHILLLEAAGLFIYPDCAPGRCWKEDATFPPGSYTQAITCLNTSLPERAWALALKNSNSTLQEASTSQGRMLWGYRIAPGFSAFSLPCSLSFSRDPVAIQHYI